MRTKIKMPNDPPWDWWQRKLERCFVSSDNFDGQGWFQGEIISIYEQNVYKIRYEDDDEETYLIPNEQKDLDQIVANTDVLRHEIGTSVSKLFEGYGWFEDKVVAIEKDRYRVRYDDGDKEDYLFDSELKELDKIIANAGN